MKKYFTLIALVLSACGSGSETSNAPATAERVDASVFQQWDITLNSNDHDDLEYFLSSDRLWQSGLDLSGLEIGENTIGGNARPDTYEERPCSACMPKTYSCYRGYTSKAFIYADGRIVFKQEHPFDACPGNTLSANPMEFTYRIEHDGRLTLCGPYGACSTSR